MKGSPVTHAPTPLKHGWLVLKVGKSVWDINVVVYLFLPLSSFPSLPLFPFQSSTSPFFVLTNSSRMAVWTVTCLWHLKTLPIDHAAYWIWHNTWQPLWGTCEVARLYHDWPTALTNSVSLRSCDYKVTRRSWFHSRLQAEQMQDLWWQETQCNTKNNSYICSCTSSTKLI